MQPHSSQTIEKKFIFSLALTAIIFVAELAGGLWTSSLALVSDSAHVFLDIFALGLSFLALRLSARPPDDRHTFGYHRLEVLAALANGATLLLISIGIGWESYQRWLAPEPVRGPEMLVIAVIGLIVNLVVAFVLRGETHEHPGEGQHHHHDLNVESAFLHVLGDAISSVGVIIAAIVIWQTGWLWVDPLTSALIGILILFSSYRVLRGSLHILIEGVPEGLSVSEIGQEMRQAAHVENVHDLHVWNICSGHVALSAHVVLSDESMAARTAAAGDLKKRLQDRFGIEHTTIQIEGPGCIQGC